MNSYNEILEKAILDLNVVEFSNLQFNHSDGIRGFSGLLGDLFGDHFFAKISMNFSKVEGSSGPRFSDEMYMRNILNCQKFQELLPGYEPSDYYVYEFDKPISVVSSLYPLLGGLCACIDFGGCYSKSNLPPDELIASTKKFIDEFLPYGFRAYNLFTTYENCPGCTGDFNHTFIACDRNKAELSIICISDSD